MQTVNDRSTSVDESANVDRLADFIMFAQRSFLLDLSKELNNGNISYAQFFLLGYLANEDYLNMTEISNKMGHSTAAATGNGPCDLTRCCKVPPRINSILMVGTWMGGADG